MGGRGKWCYLGLAWLAFLLLEGELCLTHMWDKAVVHVECNNSRRVGCGGLLIDDAMDPSPSLPLHPQSVYPLFHRWKKKKKKLLLGYVDKESRCKTHVMKNISIYWHYCIYIFSSPCVHFLFFFQKFMYLVLVLSHLVMVAFHRHTEPLTMVHSAPQKHALAFCTHQALSCYYCFSVTRLVENLWKMCHFGEHCWHIKDSAPGASYLVA